MALVYLDPPLNSAQTYNAFLHEKDGTEAASQIRAFEDTWHGDIETKKAYDQITEQPRNVSDVMQAFYTFLGGNDMMAYITMMAPRLVELRRVLNASGSLLRALTFAISPNEPFSRLNASAPRSEEAAFLLGSWHYFSLPHVIPTASAISAHPVTIELPMDRGLGTTASG